jgi:hypothetical protein
MTVSTPLSAPAWPPDTGASRKPQPLAAAGFGQFARHFGGSRGVVDQDGAILDAAENAVRAKRHGAEVIIVADAGEDEIGARSLGGRVAGGAAKLIGPLAGLLRRAVVNP